MKRIWLYTICLGLVGLFACQQEDLPSVGETGFLWIMICMWKFGMKQE